VNVLYWTERFWPHIGGVEVLSLHLIPALQQRGYAVTVVTSHSDLGLPDEAVCEGIPIYRFHFLTSLTNKDLGQLLAARRRLAALKQSFQPDLVHIHFSGPSPLFHWQTADAHPAPTLITVHSLPKRLAEQNSLLVQTMHAANWVVTVSEKTLADLRALVPSIAPRSSIIYNGLPMPAVPPAPLPFDPPRLLCLGRLVDWKGFDLALTALAALRARYPRLRLAIVGDGPARPDLEQQADQLGVRESVDFAGWVAPDQVPALINEATLVLIPSRADETLPVVALQAAQMARPVVATGVTGLPEIVRHQETGLLLPPDDAAGLVEAIAFLLEHPEAATQLGQSARQRAQRLFSLEGCVDAYEARYRALIQEFSTASPQP
jgi:glycogen(starch) synthase